MALSAWYYRATVYVSIHVTTRAPGDGACWECALQEQVLRFNSVSVKPNLGAKVCIETSAHSFRLAHVIYAKPRQCIYTYNDESLRDCTRKTNTWWVCHRVASTPLQAKGLPRTPRATVGTHFSVSESPSTSTEETLRLFSWLAAFICCPARLYQAFKSAQFLPGQMQKVLHSTVKGGLYRLAGIELYNG